MVRRADAVPRRRWAALLAVAMLAGCGGSEEQSTDATDTAVTTRTTERPAADGTGLGNAASTAARELARALNGRDCRRFRGRLHSALRATPGADCRLMRALASQSPDLDVGQVRTYATGAIARAGSTSIVLVQDVDGRFKLVSFAPRFAEAPVALGARPDASTRAAIAALRRDDCEEFFRFFMAYRPGGARAAQVCELRWLEDLGAALRRSDADPKVARLGGDGYVGFYGVHVGHRAWTAVLFAGEDRWYRISTIVRSRSDPDPGPEKP